MGTMMPAILGAPTPLPQPLVQNVYQSGIVYLQPPL